MAQEAHSSCHFRHERSSFACAAQRFQGEMQSAAALGGRAHGQAARKRVERPAHAHEHKSKAEVGPATRRQCHAQLSIASAQARCERAVISSATHDQLQIVSVVMR